MQRHARARLLAVVAKILAADVLVARRNFMKMPPAKKAAAVGGVIGAAVIAL